MMITNKLQLIQQLLTNLALVPERCTTIMAEVTELADTIQAFNCQPFALPSEYHHLLASLLMQISDCCHEDEVLERIIPLWAQLRDNGQLIGKAVDDFYRELEYFQLWQLLVSWAENQQLDALSLSKMRAIIRRYSHMPTLWTLLCELSGDQLTTAYTF